MVKIKRLYFIRNTPEINKISLNFSQIFEFHSKTRNAYQPFSKRSYRKKNRLNLKYLENYKKILKMYKKYESKYKSRRTFIIFHSLSFNYWKRMDNNFLCFKKRFLKLLDNFILMYIQRELIFKNFNIFKKRFITTS